MKRYNSFNKGNNIDLKKNKEIKASTNFYYYNDCSSIKTNIQNKINNLYDLNDENKKQIKINLFKKIINNNKRINNHCKNKKAKTYRLNELDIDYSNIKSSSIIINKNNYNNSKQYNNYISLNSDNNLNNLIQSENIQLNLKEKNKNVIYPNNNYNMINNKNFTTINNSCKNRKTKIYRNMSNPNLPSKAHLFIDSDLNSFNKNINENIFTLNRSILMKDINNITYNHNTNNNILNIQNFTEENFELYYLIIEYFYNLKELQLLTKENISLEKIQSKRNEIESLKNNIINIIKPKLIGFKD